jgi:glutathione S-transferase
MEAPMSITVHHLENSRSHRILWLLEELELAYDIKAYRREGEAKLAPPELLDVHPLGKSPVIVDGGQTIAESGAIVDYLIETYGAGRLRPPFRTDERLRYNYWLHYAEGSAMPPLLLKLIMHGISRRAPIFVRPVVEELARRLQESYIDPQLGLHMDYWEDELRRSTWFAGDDFSGADVMMSFPIEAAVVSANALKGRPKLAAFLERIHNRPAYKRALARGGGFDLSA